VSGREGGRPQGPEGESLDVAAFLAGLDDPTPEGHRAGVVALVGRPNVGKSTLLNAMVGSKVAIVTDVPGTTRNAIRGVVTRDDAQLVFLDTPGLTRPRTLLARRLNELVRETWEGVDVVCFLVDVAAGVGTGDEYLARELRELGAPVVVAANKEDQVRRDVARLAPQLATLAEWFPDADVVPTSATDGFNVEHLVDVLVEHLHEGPRLFRTGEVTDQPERQLAAEIVREKLISRMHDEVPHSIAVQVEDIRPSEDRDDLLEVDALVLVERQSQKGIVIGRGGQNLRDAGSEARAELQVLLGTRVHLDLRVKVAKEWQRDPKQLGRLGY
jgi:GTP-binding protein Era